MDIILLDIGAYICFDQMMFSSFTQLGRTYGTSDYMIFNLPRISSSLRDPRYKRLPPVGLSGPNHPGFDRHPGLQLGHPALAGFIKAESSNI